MPRLTAMLGRVSERFCRVWPFRRSPLDAISGTARNVLVVVEGQNDIEFLRRISAILHATEPQVPDLNVLERRGHIVFVPTGGGPLWPWSFRLAHLGRPEFHLYDREVPPETEIRREVAQVVNLRPRCHAVLTGKRSLENYLHPAAIYEARGVVIDIADDAPVADQVARRLYEQEEGHRLWSELPPRTRRRRRNRAKQWLNTGAVDRMTPQRLAERDPDGDVRSWLATIARMTSCPR